MDSVRTTQEGSARGITFVENGIIRVNGLEVFVSIKFIIVVDDFLKFFFVSFFDAQKNVDVDGSTGRRHTRDMALNHIDDTTKR